MVDFDRKRDLVLALLLNERNLILPDEGYDSTKVIREWRQRATLSADV